MSPDESSCSVRVIAFRTRDPSLCRTRVASQRKLFLRPARDDGSLSLSRLKSTRAALARMPSGRRSRTTRARCSARAHPWSSTAAVMWKYWATVEPPPLTELEAALALGSADPGLSARKANTCRRSKGPRTCHTAFPISQSEADEVRETRGARTAQQSASRYEVADTESRNVRRVPSAEVDSKTGESRTSVPVYAMVRRRLGMEKRVRAWLPMDR